MNLVRPYEMHRRADGRVGYFDRVGVWHNGEPSRTWADFLDGITPAGWPVMGACAALGVNPKAYTGLRGRPTRSRLRHHESCVYYLQLPESQIKVGRTTTLAARWAAHRKVLHPTALLAINRERGAGGITEQAVLEQFQASRISRRSEILHVTDELDAWIKERAAALA